MNLFDRLLFSCTVRHLKVFLVYTEMLCFFEEHNVSTAQVWINRFPVTCRHKALAENIRGLRCMCIRSSAFEGNGPNLPLPSSYRENKTRTRWYACIFPPGP